jgi:ferrochelatase
MTAALPRGTAILLIGHGSVTRAEDIPAFVLAIRRGRPAPQALVDEVTHRWNAIGGSPLQSIIEAEARALSARVSAPVAVASRLWAPYAKDVVPRLVADGAQRIVSLPLAPYSAKIYNDVTREACAAVGAQCLEVPAWGMHPALIDAFAEVIDETRAGLPAETMHVVLTAHSLPMRVIAMGDTYEKEVRATAAAIQRRLALPDERLHVAFQSQGMDGGDWLGPDLKTTFTSLASLANLGQRAKDVVVCAIGFLADHTEVLYDLDVEARAMVEPLGMRFHRAPSLNTRARFLDALEDLARTAAAT